MLPSPIVNRAARERERYDTQFGRELTVEQLLVRYGAEFSPSDQRAALLHAFEQLGDLRGKRVLEIGAGTGWHSVMLAHRGARVVATDISPVGIEVLRRRLELNNVARQVEACVAAAEQLLFDDASFDLVFGVAVLHHLVLDQAAPELARVLVPGGRAVFLEPLSENPLLDFVRDYVPYPGKKSPFNHRGITYANIRQAGEFFAETDVRPFYLTSMINRAFGNQTSITPLERLDHLLIDRIPRLRQLCRQVVVTYTAEPVAPSEREAVRHPNRAGELVSVG